jgi:hypothetical protein
VSVKAHIDWVRMNKYLNVLKHTGHMEAPNLVASCVDELDDTRARQDPGVQWQSVRATHGVSAEKYA